MRKPLFLTVICFCSSIVFAAPLDQKVEQIIRNNKLKNTRAGVYAVSLPKNKVVIDINKELPLNPASCMKLVTSAVALKTLGPDYRFPTDFYLADSDLWVKGYGDPSFVIERLEEAVNGLIAKGLPVSIDDVYIDDTYLDGGSFPGRQKGSARSYNAMTSAVALNHGSVTVEVFPGDKSGRPAQVVVDAPGVKVVNKAVTGPRRGKTTVSIKRSYTKDGDIVVVSGRIPTNSSGRKQYFNVANPTQHFGDSLKAMLVAKGVRVNGDVHYGIVPKASRPLMEEMSPPLSEILKNMNKNSSNFMAEQLTKAIGAKVKGAPGSTEKGVSAYRGYLEHLGASGFSIENGSGLSYKNELTPYDLYLVMSDIYSDRHLRDVYIDSLSIAGEDGTLKRWNNALSGKLKAKTGSLNGVSSLAGFWPQRNETILFVIFLNGGVDFTRGRRVSQAIVETFTDL
ncbi:MAG: D-alanyl-D-alanine carboxypeptidase/D-alanyl-D-alanine-endopeptidase [Deltaproteobacteria bacterium CG11_big_fil_rev_8_21_14_0_20_49_13]|nr:MAG: D-alanyl-D-alanine carboxypeptidase/D-alanyl-D-alanine-endopeptidase [Deltaproteobacteria bacterium CG11_big_fil_rev_8_21_14_0_20_49_13]